MVKKCCVYGCKTNYKSEIKKKNKTMDIEENIKESNIGRYSIWLVSVMYDSWIKFLLIFIRITNPYTHESFRWNYKNSWTCIRKDKCDSSMGTDQLGILT